MSKGGEICIWEGDLQPCIYNAIHNSEDLEVTQMPIEGAMDKEIGTDAPWNATRPIERMEFYHLQQIVPTQNQYVQWDKPVQKGQVSWWLWHTATLMQNTQHMKVNR